MDHIRRHHPKEFWMSVAAETLEINSKGFYAHPETKEPVSIAEQLDRCKAETELFTPNGFSRIRSQPVPETYAQTEIQVVHSTTLETAQKECLVAGSSVVALNFASAKHPGGGFLKGARAQEESIARSSGLYSTITLKHVKQYYLDNERDRTCLYTHNIIYSPNVPVFRNDEGDLLPEPYVVSFISSPAVNFTHAAERVDDISIIPHTLAERADRILAIASSYKHDVVILGAWGCGVFRNSVSSIAGMWRRLLVGPQAKFGKAFKKVVFAIADEEMKGRFLTCLTNPSAAQDEELYDDSDHDTRRHGGYGRGRGRSYDRKRENDRKRQGRENPDCDY